MLTNRMGFKHNYNALPSFSLLVITFEEPSALRWEVGNRTANRLAGETQMIWNQENVLYILRYFFLWTNVLVIPT